MTSAHDATINFLRFTKFGLCRDAERASLELTAPKKSKYVLRAPGLLARIAISGGLYAAGGVVSSLLAQAALTKFFLIDICPMMTTRALPDWANAAIGHFL
jgi:hypothetical protein